MISKQHSLPKALIVLIIPALIVTLWQILSATVYTSELVLPSPRVVVQTGWSLAESGDLWRHTKASLTRLAWGGVLGVVTGVLAGFAAGRSAVAAALLRPLVGFFSGISGIIWIPLAFVWFGTGLAMTTFLIWNSVFFIVLANTVQGVQQSHSIFQHAIRTMGGSRWVVLRSAVLPSALPSILTGVRVGLGFAWRALIAAEILGSPVGLGQMIYQAAAWQRTDIMIAGALVIGLLGTLFDRLVLETIERRTVVRWGMVSALNDRGAG